MAHNEIETRVLKHSLPSRLFHWCLILGFLPAAITGFILWLKLGNETFINLAMRIHIVGAIIFTSAVIIYTVCCLNLVIAFMRRIFSWDSRDLGWILIGGGYPQKMFLGKKITVPPMGKINSGQKIFGICLLFSGLILMASGWILYAFIPVSPKLFIYWSNRIHLVFGIFMGLFVFVHIFLGIYNWGEFKTMFGNGTQPLDEAKDHNPVWVEHEIEPVQNTKSNTKVLVQ
ncbi:MAG: prokaryotic cytochrome b561 [Firmicutes bacterium]|nr:prokaryotic cytochrome b561 [Bacillota bacterium]